MTLLEEEHTQKLLFLKLLYGKVIEILDVTKSGFVMLDDEILNHHYIKLTLSIDTILKGERFEDLKKEAPQIFDSLLGNLEEIDNRWDHLRNELLQFIGKLQKEYLITNIVECRLSKESKNTFISIDKAIGEHKKNVKFQSEKLEKLELPRLNQIKEQFSKYKHNLDIDDEQVNNKGNIHYQYNENEKIGKLAIGQYPKIEFSKLPALIVKYYFDSKDLDNDYKSYHDFQETHFLKELTSDSFSKSIAKINQRISRDTKNKIKQIICKDDKQKATEINRYRWKIIT